MKYWVTMAINGRYTIEVDADKLQDAKEKVKKKYVDADFGELECIDACPVNAADEHENHFDL